MKKKVSERTLTTKQAVTQMNHYWKDLDHMASDAMKKKNMDMRFGIKDIKLDRYGNIISFNKYKRGAFEELEIDEAMSRKDMLKLALAKHKYKKSGGKVEKELNSLIKYLVSKHLTSILGKNTVISTHEYELWGGMKRHLKGDGKKLRLVIKDYFDGVERVIKKNKKVMSSIFYGYAKSKRMTDNAWDEQIVNNIKVKKVHLIKPSRLKIDTSNPDHTHPIDSFQIAKEAAEKLFDTVKVWDATETMDLEIYTRKVVAKEQPKRNIAY